MPERLADPAQANAYLTAILEAARDAKGTLDTVREFYYSTGNVDLQEHSEASKLLAAALQQEGVGRSTELAPGEAATKALSPREWDVLRLLADGMKNREIAETLFVSENTVKTHIRGILTKLSLKNRTQAATFALLDSRAY
ncbi:MAG: response regulator transcription factor [Chloroflexi bacterium]|nr:response regulator transcription factor [Chloroflexota bacterium]MCH7655037.1 response regulator transcription factor [Chloroflexota bacterium]